MAPARHGGLHPARSGIWPALAVRPGKKRHWGQVSLASQPIGFAGQDLAPNPGLGQQRAVVGGQLAVERRQFGRGANGLVDVGGDAGAVEAGGVGGLS